MTDYMFSVELKKLLKETMQDISDFDIEFLVEQASYMSNIERQYFMEVLERLVGMVQ